ncbi:SH3 and PX domain-containing protein 2B-like [Watersipora subatra]|uniref:SH3 and PX domain-containing protein 2B-like n=1 Tax=Watersipora subatra TaxID=2589382 RepID=UPI00355B77F3
METRFVQTVSCSSFHLRVEPSKHYVYEIRLKWSDGQSAVVYRRYSEFFNLQCKLLDTFPCEAGANDPSKRTLPFMPGKRLLGNTSQKTAEKRRDKFNGYLNALIQLPNVGACSLVQKFFELKESDLTGLLSKKTSSVKRSSIKGHNISGPVSFPQYVAVDGYKKSQNGELSFKAGAILTIVEKKNTGWWLAQSQDGEEHGWVPAGYLDPIGSDTDEDEDELSTLPSEPQNFIVTTGYTAIENDELSILKGCIVQVLVQSNHGWWTCRYQERVGCFPAAYLKKANTLQAKKLLELDKHESKIVRSVTPVVERQLSHYAPPRRDYSKPKPVRPPAPVINLVPSYVAIADFTNTMSDGIDLVEGMQVKVMNKDCSGWWFVEVDGGTGWAPSTYIQSVLPSEPVQNPQISVKQVKPPRPDRPPSAKTSPIVARSSAVKGNDRDDVPTAASCTSNNNNLSAVLCKASNSQPAHKPKIPKKPNLSGANSYSRSCAEVRQEEPEAQLSVAELRKKLSSNLRT